MTTMSLDRYSYMLLQPESRPVGFPRRQVLTMLSILASLAMIWLTFATVWPSLDLASDISFAHLYWKMSANHYGHLEKQDWEADTTEGAPAVTISTTTQQPEFPSGAAVIIETRTTPNLVPLLLHFSATLGAGWPVVLFTPAEAWTAPASAALHRALAEGRIRIRHLPANLTGFATHNSVSLFLSGEWLWAQLADAPRVLLFQTDSVICANANGTVDDFARWDLVGAPIAPRWGRGYNGGLSLRNPRLMRDIVRSHGDEFRRANSAPGGGGGGGALPAHERFEDQWFYSKAVEMGANLPSPEVAREFAVETVYFERPLGFHQPARWQKDKMEEILAWCPEVAMLEGQAKFG
ncbi:hypothetical protein RB594_002560 [Gaeumannomyces avenae]